jgi:hypothetical protein
MKTRFAINRLTACETADSRGGVHDAWSFGLCPVFLQTVANVSELPAASTFDTGRNTLI